MAYLSNEARKIYEIILDYGPIRPSQIAVKAEISNKNLHKHLVHLLEEGVIEKSGSAPMSFYQKKESTSEIRESLDYSDELIALKYIYLSPSGEIIRGVEGFRTWCRKNGFDYVKEKAKYVERLKSIQRIKKNGLISAKKIILSGKHSLALNNIFFSDFYNIDHFGKTKLGQLVYVAKSSQNKALVGEIAEIIRPSLISLIKRYDIEMVCFIPPTIGRRVQFMDVLEKQLRLDVPKMKIMKVKTLTLIPQKSIRKLEDRIINASKTIALDPNQKIIGNVLIIDDATGSGATMNETAKKIRKIIDGQGLQLKMVRKNSKSSATKIYGYSIIGSYKGFDVISEV